MLSLKPGAGARSDEPQLCASYARDPFTNCGCTVTVVAPERVTVACTATNITGEDSTSFDGSSRTLVPSWTASTLTAPPA